jgi:hypothetical protein
MTIHTDFNTAESSSYDLIPEGTIARAELNLQQGNYMGGFLNKNENTGSIGLKAEFTLTGGEYKGRKVYQLIGVEGMKKDEQGNDKWGGMGRKLIRSLLESARGVSSKDETQAAIDARKIKSYAELNGLSCVIKIGVEEDKTGQYKDKNKVVRAITIDSKDYAQFAADTPQSASVKQPIPNVGYRPNKGAVPNQKDPLDDEIPF